MKVSTDSVLLGAWAPIEHSTSILDIGTGTGLLAIMAAQRNASATITAIDINEDATMQARENADQSPWKERINIFTADVREYAPELLFDAIICNPPFFTRSLRNPDKARATARHDETLSLEELSSAAASLLAGKGCVAVVLPIERRADILSAMSMHGLFLFRETRIRPTPQKAPKRVLMAFRKEFSTQPLTDEICISSSPGQYTDEYKKITKEFYLNF